MSSLSIEDLIAEAGPTSGWEGQCYAIACIAAPLVGGEAVYGHWLGNVSSDGYWAAYKDLSVIRHGWVVLPNGNLLDPTRWSFEAVAPYIWEGPPGLPYDPGGQRLRKEFRRDPPEPQGNTIHLNLSQKVQSYLGGMLGIEWTKGDLTAIELGWLANAPLDDLEPHAPEFFQALIEESLGAFIPIDHRRAMEPYMRPKRTLEDNGCTTAGTGGMHSDSYYDDSECKWCGKVSEEVSIGR